ncbi:ribonuclease H-like protein, partial [Calocera viscosa TUFC12733]
MAEAGVAVGGIGKGPAASGSVQLAEVAEVAEIAVEADDPAEAEADPDLLLPPYSYLLSTPSPTRVHTRSASEMNDLLPLLSGPLGFDMEWKFGFTRERGGPPRKWESRTGTIQLGDERLVLILQVEGMRELPRELRRVIEDPEVPKMGVNIRLDFRKLVRDFPGLRPAHVVELSFLAKCVDPALPSNRKLVSLARLTARYLHARLSKDQEVRCSDWTGELGEAQLEYAANDVHASMQVGRVLLERA